MSETSIRYEWELHPQAEAWLAERVDGLMAELPPARTFSRDLLLRAGCRLADFLDHIIVASGDLPRGQLRDLGFEIEAVEAQPGDEIYHHPGAIFPRVVLRSVAGQTPGTPIGASIQVEEISSFLMAKRRAVPVEGTPLGPYRRATVWKQSGHEFGVVERRGHPGFVPTVLDGGYPERHLRAIELWGSRPRVFEQTESGMVRTLELARRLAAEVGCDTAAWIAFAAERAYWQQRNRAGQVQKARQDTLGLGWANHDHCAFRSSREAFALLIQIFQTLGFGPRERFHAGAEAGWGAQVMEQPACRLAVFCDVDLSPEEVNTDFSAVPLAPREQLGTIGLWCALHGESILAAGAHHLASRFDFDTVTGQLAESDIRMMRPFSTFPHLRQAFTRGERWGVDPGRLQRLAASGQITGEQRDQFVEKGALGSHMESIQRGKGFKGFNQERVSDIIQRTDPRKAEDGT